MEPAGHNRDTHSDAQPVHAPLELKQRDDRPLPRCLESIREQLEPEHIAKLRAIDKSRAQVALRVRGGKHTQPEPFSGFILDFATEAAEAVETGGPILAIVYPNDGVMENFSFGFVAPGEVRKGKQSSGEVEMLRAELRAMKEDQQRMMLLAASGGGGGSLKDRLEELKLLKEISGSGAAPAPAPDMNAQIASMGQAFSGMFQAMGQGMGAMKQVSAEMVAAAPEKSLAGEIKEIMSIEGAPQLAREIVDRALPKRATSVATNQGGQQPAGTPAARPNPLERIA